jgi:hypothetical protein
MPPLAILRGAVADITTEWGVDGDDRRDAAGELELAPDPRAGHGRPTTRFFARRAIRCGLPDVMADTSLASRAVRYSCDRSPRRSSSGA